LGLALGEVEVRAVAVRQLCSEKGSQIPHLTIGRGGTPKTIHGESTVFLTEMQAALRNQPPQNLAGVSHRATVWLSLI
jgi:hypothetical protein